MQGEGEIFKKGCWGEILNCPIFYSVGNSGFILFLSFAWVNPFVDFQFIDPFCLWLCVDFLAIFVGFFLDCIIVSFL